MVDPGDTASAAERAALFESRAAFGADGTAINSGKYNGLPTPQIKSAITADLATQGMGRGAVVYKLRDWLFSRQRFWGEPFPILHELGPDDKPTGILRTIPADELPVNLPELADFKPHGRPEPPLEKAPHDWLYVTRDGRRYKRETNTMPQWAGSCWYYLRFIDTKNPDALVNRELERAWMPVDLYIGGAEHAVLHLLYARFWHKVLFDRGHVSTPEPFLKLINQGMILGEMEFTAYRHEDKSWLSAADVGHDSDNKPIDRRTRSGRSHKVRPAARRRGEKRRQNSFAVLKADPAIRVESRAHKMSKSRGNVVSPDKVVEEYGADALRLYEMSYGPARCNQALEHDRGQRRSDVSRSRLADDRRRTQRSDGTESGRPSRAAKRRAEPRAPQNTRGGDGRHRAAGFQYRDRANDGIHELFHQGRSPPARGDGEIRAGAVSVRASSRGRVVAASRARSHVGLLSRGPRPIRSGLQVKTWLEVPVQINGKLRGRLVAPTGADAAALESLRRADGGVAELIAEKTIVAAVVVPGRLVPS